MVRERVSRSSSRRLVAAILLGVIACVLGGAFRAKNLPLDDAYIHLSYGIDFDLRSLFSFQAHHRDTGTSSWVWTAIAILVARLHLPEYATVTALSVAIFCALLHRVMTLVARAIPRETPLSSAWPILSALLVAANGNVLWLSISGMETGLSILLLCATIPRILGRRGMTMGTGLLALLLVWTRIEAVVWLGAALVLLPFTKRGDGVRARRGWILPIAGLAIYVAYNLSVCGYVLPTTGISKRTTYIPGGHNLKEEWKFVSYLTRDYLRPLIPGWLVEVGAAALALAVLLARSLRRRRLDPEVAALVALVGGAFVHTALNVVEYRSAYHHLRYFAPILALIPAFAPALVLRAGARAAKVRWAVPAIAAPLFAWAFFRDARAAAAWARLHLQNAEQLGAVHLAVGAHLRKEAPAGTKRVASFDIGALRWASHLEIVDLAGTSDRRTLDYRRASKHADLVRDSHAELYISIENGFDYIPTSTPSFDLEHLRTWQFPEYPDPYPPHTKRMVLYRVNHCGEPRLIRDWVGARITFDFDPSDERARAAAGKAEGTSFSRWPVNARDLGRNVLQAQGRFLASDSDPQRDRATGRFETVPMTAEGDWLSFRMAGGRDPRRLRVELRSEGKALASWTGFNADSFLEIVHPISELRGKSFTLALIDEATGGWGHLFLDEVRQFVWREAPPKPCPVNARRAVISSW
jgi:hypothetical protein